MRVRYAGDAPEALATSHAQRPPLTGRIRELPRPRRSSGCPNSSPDPEILWVYPERHMAHGLNRPWLHPGIAWALDPASVVRCGFGGLVVGSALVPRTVQAISCGIQLPGLCTSINGIIGRSGDIRRWDKAKTPLRVGCLLCRVLWANWRLTRWAKAKT